MCYPFCWLLLELGYWPGPLPKGVTMTFWTLLLIERLMVGFCILAFFWVLPPAKPTLCLLFVWCGKAELF